ncbi:hypothetical protein AMAG_00926 [Allomyces macrogynus ATCC 38327]|uniref:RING-type domain-containing protein n=1 Tax=Allomyces macrogynus (strain ATCC 38327) TaxID=578462 RepID=A0A0L0RY33_ALLM3|nr:hypothetical protein AMAG_00926 [Allomyces macrogynus ATCC 38327]|eukprot:KNE54989.1 hypothetical protein AMAG_00926 [Allomyces macrogynus ATCC 38327]
MGQVASNPTAAAVAQLRALVGATNPAAPPARAPTPGSPTGAPGANSTTTDPGAPEWLGNSLYFGPHFVLRHPGAATGATAPGNNANALHIISDHVAALAATATARAAESGMAGIGAGTVAAWDAQRHEASDVPGQVSALSTTIQCLVNVKRSSLALVTVPQAIPAAGPSSTPISIPSNRPHASLRFTFDAAVPCTVRVFLAVREKDGKRLVPLSPTDFPAPFAQASYPAGLGHTYDLPRAIDISALQSAVAAHIPPLSPTSPNPSTSPTSFFAKPVPPASPTSASSTSPLYETNELRALRSAALSPPDPLYHLVITVTGTTNPPAASASTVAATDQWTYLVLDHGGDSVRCVKQKLWIGSTPMLLQEIYGFAEAPAAGSPDAAAAAAAMLPECIVCMADAKDTIVLPCRHLCLCKECALLLRKQSHKCPICRQDFHSLLHIARLAKGGGGATAGTGGVVPPSAPNAQDVMKSVDLTTADVGVETGGLRARTRTADDVAAGAAVPGSAGV